MTGIDECQLCFQQRVVKLLGKCHSAQGSQTARGLPNSSHPCFGFHGDEAFGSMSGPTRLADGTRPPKFFVPFPPVELTLARVMALVQALALAQTKAQARALTLALAWHGV